MVEGRSIESFRERGKIIREKLEGLAGGLIGEILKTWVGIWRDYFSKRNYYDPSRRRALHFLMAAGAAFFLRCVPPIEEESFQPDSPKVELKLLPPYTYERFVETCSEEFLRPYVHDDQLIFEIDPNNNAIINTNYLRKVLEGEQPEELIIVNRATVIIEAKDDDINFLVRRLYNPNDYYHGEVSLEFVILETKKGNSVKRYLIPSIWMKRDFVERLPDITIFTDSRSETTILRHFLNKIIEEKRGIKIPQEKLLEIAKGPDVSVYTQPEILKKHAYTIDGNPGIYRIYMATRLSEKLRNVDVSLFNKWAKEGYDVIVVELRTIFFDKPDTKGEARFLFIATKGTETELLIVPDNYKVAKGIRNIFLNSTNPENHINHHLLRHSIDYPKDSFWEELRGLLSKQENLPSLQKLFNSDIGHSLNIGDIKFTVEDKVEYENIRHVMIRVEKKGKIRYLIIHGNPKSPERFITWHPLSNEFWGASADPDRITKIRQHSKIIIEEIEEFKKSGTQTSPPIATPPVRTNRSQARINNRVGDIIGATQGFKDPIIRFGVSEIIFSFLYDSLVEALNAKDRLISLIYENKDFFSEILKKEIFYVGIGRWVIKVAKRKKTLYESYEREFFAKSNIFEIYGEYLGEEYLGKDYRLLCELLEPDERLLENAGAKIHGVENIENALNSAFKKENIGNIYRVYRNESAVYEYYGVVIEK